MTQPATAPVASRASASCGSVETVPQTVTSTAASALIDGDGAVFPETVGHRADDELDRAVGDGISRDHNRGDADRGLEVGGNLRQQRIGHPHLRLAGKAGDREQQDRARRRFCAEAGG